MKWKIKSPEYESGAWIGASGAALDHPTGARIRSRRVCVDGSYFRNIMFDGFDCVIWFDDSIRCFWFDYMIQWFHSLIWLVDSIIRLGGLICQFDWVLLIWWYDLMNRIVNLIRCFWFDLMPLIGLFESMMLQIQWFESNHSTRFDCNDL